jgi:hypothetical protein
LIMKDIKSIALGIIINTGARQNSQVLLTIHTTKLGL